MAKIYSFPLSSGNPRSRKMPERLRVSFQSMGLIVGLAEFATIILASIFGQTIYQSFWLTQAGTPKLAAGVGLIAALIYVSLARFAELYQLAPFLNPDRHFASVACIWASCLSVLITLLFLFGVDADLSRGMLLIVSLGLLLALVPRYAAGQIIRTRMAHGAVAGRPVITIGDPKELGPAGNPTLFQDFGMTEVGRVVIGQPQNEDAISDNTTVEEALALARQWKAEEFVIALGWQDRRLLIEINEGLRNSPLPVRLLPDQSVRSLLVQHVTPGLGSMSTIELQRAPMTSAERAAKRVMDIVFAGIGILIISPLLIFVALAIKLDSPGPVLFRQRRNGFDQFPFVIYKFRTMHVLEDGETLTQAQLGDPRVTRVGRLLRRSSLDELPQLFNVLKGEMSLVGPRPHALAHDGRYKSIIDAYCFRHHVKPGITGWAQVNRARGETKYLRQMQRRVEFDLWYIDHWSVLLDIRILLRTVQEVLKREAY